MRGRDRSQSKSGALTWVEDSETTQEQDGFISHADYFQLQLHSALYIAIKAINIGYKCTLRYMPHKMQTYPVLA